MPKTRVWITLSCCLIALAVFAWAQSGRKPGLWEMTSTMTYQQSPFPPGMPASSLAAMSAPHTTQVCVTQAMIDKYGGPYSNPPRGDCKVTNISLRADGMTASLACTGQMNATGTVETKFVEGGNTTDATVHIRGTMKPAWVPKDVASNSVPVDITIQTTSVYKGADCGSVQPFPTPAGK